MLQYPVDASIRWNRQGRKHPREINGTPKRKPNFSITIFIATFRVARLIATFRVTRLTLQTRKLWLVGRCRDRPKRWRHAARPHPLLTQKKKKKKKQTNKQTKLNQEKRRKKKQTIKSKKENRKKT